MLYKIIKFLLKIYLPVFFKKIEYRGFENIPKDKPLILAVNHQNAFMDGLLVAIKLRRPVFFLTRSDVFKGKWVIKIFKSMNLVPIFRKQDFTGDIILKNQETFKYCIKELENKNPILIFPEGVSEPVHHLFDLKKGLARLAFEVEAKHDFKLGLQVVPVAINYENHFVGGKKVFVNYLAPILISDYKSIYLDRPSRAKRVFLDKVETDLKENLIHISGDYAKFKERYWKEIISQSENDKEIIKSVKSTPIVGDKFTTKGYRWRLDKYRYNKKRSLISRVFYFIICLPGFIFFLPTILITKLILSKIKDESFYLSITSLCWLIFGVAQTVLASIYIYAEINCKIFLLSVTIIILVAFITLRNFFKHLKIDV